MTEFNDQLNEFMLFKFLTTIAGKNGNYTSSNLINCSIIGINVIYFAV